MPSSFAREEVRQRFVQLIESLEGFRGGGQAGEKVQEVIDRVKEAQQDFETMGGPQGGQVG